MTTEDQRTLLEIEKELDFSFDCPDCTTLEGSKSARFRVNAYYQSGVLSIALRLIPLKIRTLEELNLPKVIEEFSKARQGFVLVVGPAGHGKSSVMAALINLINDTRDDHVITVEDPIEYVFEQNRCIIDQREVGRDTKSFGRAIRAALREDVDVVMIGEMRDLESMSAALTMAETGHLVFASLHTSTAAQTVDRIIDSFPAHQQDQVRAQLASVLLGVVSRRLIPTIKGDLTSAAEVLFVNPAVRNLVREGKTHQIDLVIDTSASEGMISLNRSLAERVKEGLITLEQALGYSLNPDELKSSV
jgi:twitching motility protein PilT